LNTSDIETNEKSVFTKRTIGQLLFDGFPIKIFEKIEEFIEDTHKFAPFIKLIKLNPFRISDKVSHMHSFL
jgi:histone deacetylase complex regulatory component SIN3